MRITSAGYVGIGTTTPQVPLSVGINGTASINAHSFPPGTSGSWQYYNAATTNPTDVSIYAVGTIHASTIRVFSDERIKSIQGISNSQSDLDTLLSVQITDYRYKDAVTRGSRPQKKVIAQQVEKVFPQAVSKTTDVVPDIYQKAAVKAGWIELKTTLKKGERVRLITEKDEGVHEVLEVREGAFRTTFEPKTDTVFVYGREVKDFRTVDYEAISMLNVSATQEIARRLEAKTAEVAALEERVKKLEARDKARDAKLAALERLLLSDQKPAARTASLKKAADGAE